MAECEVADAAGRQQLASGANPTFRLRIMALSNYAAMYCSQAPDTHEATDDDAAGDGRMAGHTGG